MTDFRNVPLTGLFNGDAEHAAVALLEVYMAGRISALKDAGLLAGSFSRTNPEIDEALRERIKAAMVPRFGG